MPDVQSVQYRMSFLPVYGTLLPTICLGSVGVLVLTNHYLGHPTGALDIAVALGFGWLTTLFTSFSVVLAFPCRLHRDGISGWNVWGAPAVILWEDIADVRTGGYLFMKFYRVFHKNRRLPVWIPRHLGDPKSFRERLLEVAPPGNPFREYWN